MATVVLIHGIWMNGWDMTLLRHRLKKAGFNVAQFSYPSVRKDLRQSAKQLRKFTSRIDDIEIHMVAHSLGGLLVRLLFHDFPNQKSGRIVTLGTPHQGSTLAKRLRQNFLGKLILGKSLNHLLGNLPPWTSDHEFGVIAGDRGIGVGTFLTRLPKPNDGTVLVDETSLEGMRDYKIMHINHMGMMFSKDVANEVITFLRTGHFHHRATGNNC